MRASLRLNRKSVSIAVIGSDASSSTARTSGAAHPGLRWRSTLGAALRSGSVAASWTTSANSRNVAAVSEFQSAPPTPTK